MEIIYQSKVNYRDWDVFLKNENDLNLWAYTKKFMDQCGISFEKKDLSFAVIEDNSVIGICPLFITNVHGYKEISDDGGYLRSYIATSSADGRKRERIYDTINSEIDRISCEYNVKKIMYSQDPQITNKSDGNPFLKYNYLNSSINTQLIDLDCEIEILRQGFRKSYKALVNKGLKTYDFKVMNCQNPDYELHELYRETHKKAAGRETRSKHSFDLQFDQLLNGEATLVAVSYEGSYVQLNYFNHFNNYVYYASAADDPEFTKSCDVPIGHSIIWFAIEYFKRINFRFFELGLQYTKNNLFDDISDKEINISYFKRGFGGRNVPVFRGIKFYDLGILSNLFDRIA